MKRQRFFVLPLGLAFIALFQNCDGFNTQAAVENQEQQRQLQSLVSSDFAATATPRAVMTLEPNHLDLRIQTQPVAGRVPINEIPPFVIDGDWPTFLITTGHTFRVSFSPVANPIFLYGLQERPLNSSSSSGVLMSVPTLPNPNDSRLSVIKSTDAQWLRNYAGAFGGFLDRAPGETQDRLFTINHGENKNEYVDGAYHWNTINDDNANCWAGVYPGATEYVGCNYNYNGFIYIEKRFWESGRGYGNEVERHLGPVIWPANGYLQVVNGTPLKTSQGVRHPSVFIEGEYVYIYYQDTFAAYDPNNLAQRTLQDSLRGDAERSDGIKVARASKEDLRLGRPFKVFFNGAFSEPAVPVGNLTNASHFQASLTAKGPRAKLMVPAGHNVQRFAVARVRNTPWLVAVVNYNDWSGNTKIGLSYSKDLVTWSPIQLLAEAPEESFSLDYALPIDKYGRSNMVVDKEDFRLVGVNRKNGLIFRAWVQLVMP